MGLEAQSELVTEDGAVAVKALLESDTLILRGGYRKTFARKDIVHPRTAGDQLLFEYDAETYALVLPAGQADKWLKKLTLPVPTLAAKLGIDAAHPMLVRGQIADPVLSDALSGAVTHEPAIATQGLVIADSPEALDAALPGLIAALPLAHLWIVYPKGAKSALPESVVRSRLHGLGYVDTKACAVSETLTAARFSRRK